MAVAEPPMPVISSADLDNLAVESDQIDSDADAIDESLNRLRSSQAASGWGLRTDVSERQKNLQRNRLRIRDAIRRQDAASARKFMELAWQDIKSLHQFLGR
jgi:hypothetical protein